MSAGRHRILAGFVTLSMAGMAIMAVMVLIFEGGGQGFEYSLLGVGAISALTWWLWRGPVGKALARMLEGDISADAQVMARMADLEDRLAELGLEAQRMAELEDRLEFTERLLGSVTGREEQR